MKLKKAIFIIIIICISFFNLLSGFLVGEWNILSYLKETGDIKPLDSIIEADNTLYFTAVRGISRCNINDNLSIEKPARTIYEDNKLTVFLDHQDYTIEYTSSNIRDFASGLDKIHGGDSAGLMIYLQILQQKTTEDITHGHRITGSATLNSQGLTGEVIGISAKVEAAHNNDMDIFFITKDRGENFSNEETALKKAEELNSNMKIIPVGSLLEAVDYLNQI